MRKGTKRTVSLLVACMMLFSAAELASPVLSVAEDRTAASGSERSLDTLQKVGPEDVFMETDESAGTEESDFLSEEDAEDLQNDPESVSAVTGSVNSTSNFGGKRGGYIEIPVEELYRYFNITDSTIDSVVENAGEDSAGEPESVPAADLPEDTAATVPTADITEAESM